MSRRVYAQANVHNTRSAMMWNRPGVGQMPPGTIENVVESDEVCACHGCNGRTYEAMNKPAFVRLSDSRWAELNTELSGAVQGYRREGRFFIWMAFFIVVGQALFHPAFGVVARGGGRRLEADYKWSDYTRMCGIACTYADQASADTSCDAANVVPRQSGRARFPVAATTSPTCTRRRHDPCFAEVRLPGADVSTWHSCCSMWSHWSGQCTAEQKTMNEGLLCDEPAAGSTADGCPGDAKHDDEDKGDGDGLGLGASIPLLMLSMMCGVVLGIGGSMWATGKNQEVDLVIDGILARATTEAGGTATFRYARCWTQKCKPKGARTYRAIWVSPPHAQMQMLPPGHGGVQMQVQAQGSMPIMATGAMPVAGYVAPQAGAIAPMAMAVGPAAPVNVAAQLQQLQAMHAAGQLNDVQYEAAKNQALGVAPAAAMPVAGKMY